MTNENIQDCLRLALSLHWKQNWRNWQEVENAIPPTNRTINNAEKFVNNHMIYSVYLCIDDML